MRIFDDFLNACRNGKTPQAVFILSKNTFIPNDVLVRGLNLALLHNRTSVAYWLISLPNLSLDSNLNRTFIIACIRGHLKVVQLLLDRPDVKSDALNNEAFYAATTNGHHEVVGILLNHNAILSTYSFEKALAAAIQHSYPLVLNILLQHKQKESNNTLGEFNSILSIDSAIVKDVIDEIIKQESIHELIEVQIKELRNSYKQIDDSLKTLLKSYLKESDQYIYKLLRLATNRLNENHQPLLEPSSEDDINPKLPLIEVQSKYFLSNSSLFEKYFSLSEFKQMERVASSRINMCPISVYLASEEGKSCFDEFRKKNLLPYSAVKLQVGFSNPISVSAGNSVCVFAHVDEDENEEDEEDDYFPPITLEQMKAAMKPSAVANKTLNLVERHNRC